MLNYTKKNYKRLNIYGKIVKLDHDGNCSDNECVVSKKYFNYIIKVPKKYKHCHYGKIIDFDSDYLFDFLQDQKINDSGSKWCKYKKNKYDLYKHDYKYIIKGARVINIR